MTPRTRWLRRARRFEIAAKASVDHRIAVLAGGGAEEAPASVESARQRVRECEDRLAAAQAARAEIDRRSREVDEWLPARELIVRSEAARVMWSEVRPAIVALTREAAAAQKLWLSKAAALGVLLTTSPTPFPEDDAELVAARSQVRQLETLPVSWPAVKEVDRTAQDWREVFVLLQQDAATKLKVS